MQKSWYKKSMPTIETITPCLPKLACSIYSIDNVKSVLLWGSVAQHLEDKDFIPKDLDIIAVTDLFSEDLAAISDDDNSPFSLTIDALEDEGYDPEAVHFTKKYIVIKDFNIDHWVLSGDNKLLHWGPTIENQHDWEEIKQEAERYANDISPTSYQKLSHTSNKNKQNWLLNYNQYINKFLSEAPEGWYLSKIDAHVLRDTTKKLLKIT